MNAIATKETNSAPTAALGLGARLQEHPLVSAVIPAASRPARAAETRGWTKGMETMKSTTTTLIVALTLSVAAVSLIAQDAPPEQRRPQPPEGAPREGGPRGGGPGREGFRPPMGGSPIIAALDANKDGVIDADEITNATVALKALDKNKDGKLSDEEVRPTFMGRGPGGPGDRAQGGPDGFRGPGGQRGQGGPDGRPGPDGQEGRGFREFGGGPNGQRGPGPDGARGPGGPGGRPSPDEFVGRIMGFDKDNDGKVAKAELPEPMQRMFDRADGNTDGFIDKTEARTFAENMRAEGPGPGFRPDGPRGPRPDGDNNTPRRPARPTEESKGDK